MQLYITDHNEKHSWEHTLTTIITNMYGLKIYIVLSHDRVSLEIQIVLFIAHDCL